MRISSKAPGKTGGFSIFLFFLLFSPLSAPNEVGLLHLCYHNILLPFPFLQ